MATLANLRNRLIGDASINPVEGIKYSQLDTLLANALLQHNRSYTFASLPATEEEPVLLLAWAAVCYIRAGKVAPENNAQGSNGYAQDRETPFKKNMELAKSLMDRYTLLCTAFGLNTATTGIVVGTILSHNPVTDSLTPLHTAPVPALVTVSAEVVEDEDTSALLSWSITRLSEEYFDVMIFTDEGTELMFQPWNIDSDSGIPKVKNGARLLATISDPQQTVVKVEDMDRSVANRFLVVVRSGSLKYAYGNEVTVAAE